MEELEYDFKINDPKVIMNLDIIESELKEIDDIEQEEFKHKERTNTFGIDLEDNLNTEYQDWMLSRLMNSLGLTKPSKYKNKVKVEINMDNQYRKLFDILEYIQLPNLGMLYIDMDIQNYISEETMEAYDRRYFEKLYNLFQIFKNFLTKLPIGSSLPICFTRGVDILQVKVENLCNCGNNGEFSLEVETIIKLSRIVIHELTIKNFYCCENCFQKILSEYQHLEQINFFDSHIKFINHLQFMFNQNCTIKILNFANCDGFKTVDMEILLISIKDSLLEKTLKTIGIHNTDVDIERCSQLANDLELDIEFSKNEII